MDFCNFQVWSRNICCCAVRGLCCRYFLLLSLRFLFCSFLVYLLKWFTQSVNERERESVLYEARCNEIEMKKRERRRQKGSRYENSLQPLCVSKNKTFARKNIHTLTGKHTAVLYSFFYPHMNWISIARLLHSFDFIFIFSFCLLFFSRFYSVYIFLCAFTPCCCRSPSYFHTFFVFSVRLFLFSVTAFWDIEFIDFSLWQFELLVVIILGIARETEWKRD